MQSMKVRLFIFLMLILLSWPVPGKNRWHVSFTPGLSYVPPAPLIIRQTGEPTIRLWAKYESAPLKLPPYYSYRLGFMEDNHGWELEMNHLKIYLNDRPEEIERFSISHGYNQVFINRIYRKGKYNLKAGAGVVAAHPENNIRGKALDEQKGLFSAGYYITGPAFQYGCWKEFSAGKHFFILAEARISAAWASVPVAEGRAHAPVLALHLQIGPGFRL